MARLRLAAAALAAALLGPAPRAAEGCPEGMHPLSGGRFRFADGTADATVAPFCLDDIEVTAAGYAACVRSGTCRAEGLACGKAATFSAKGKGSHPINCVTWFEADRFCRAQGKRLPTEAEFEWAARGQALALTYPWGAARPGRQACWDGPGNALGPGNRNETCPVASHPDGATPDGLQDLAGNVREWTATADGRYRVVRGGSWGDSLPDFLAAGFRGSNAPDERLELTGFRCAAEPGAEVRAFAPAAGAPTRMVTSVGDVQVTPVDGGSGGR